MPLTTVGVDALVSDARANGKPVVLYFGTVWCAPCQVVAHEVLPNRDVQAALSEYVFAKYDAELGAGAEAAERFVVRGFPELVFLDPHGKEVDRTLAPQDPASFAKRLREMRPLAAAGVNFDPKAERDPEKLLAAGRIALRKPLTAPAAEGGGQARPLFEAAMARDPENKAGVRAEAAFELLRMDARKRDKEAHQKLLLGFAKAYPRSPQAAQALAGLAVLAGEVAIDTKAVCALLADARAARLEAKDADHLRMIGAVYERLGKLEDASAVQAEAERVRAGAGEGSRRSGPPTFMSDPLDRTFSMASSPPSTPQAREQMAAFARERRTSRELSEACKHHPRVDDEVYIRIIGQPGQVPRVVVLDPDAPPRLRACLEQAARALGPLPKGAAPRTTVRVDFEPGAGHGG
jgi:thiol-disulfide isomerase/thioredoxin